jgi:hypothetical protein
MGRRSRTEIEDLLEAYRKRGKQTRASFCEQQGISSSALDYYLRRYGKPLAPAGRPMVRLARVRVETQAAAGPFVLRLTNGRRIECGEAALAQLIRIAESA